MPPLNDLFAFERDNWQHTSRKELLIVERFGIPPALYYRQLHRAAASMLGQAHDGELAHRITRRKEEARS